MSSVIHFDDWRQEEKEAVPALPYLPTTAQDDKNVNLVYYTNDQLGFKLGSSLLAPNLPNT